MLRFQFSFHSKYPWPLFQVTFAVSPPISHYFRIFQSPQSDMSQGLRFGGEKKLKEPAQVKKEAVALSNRNFEVESNK